MVSASLRSMQKLRDHVWNWLPTFLRVAEEGSIRDASRALHVTPAAVSRTIRLLEGEFEQPLFSRVGRSLVLNERGVRLRDSLREAMTTVDRGIARTLTSPFAGPLRVASLGVLTDHFVVDTLLDLKGRYPELLPEHRNMATASAAKEVAEGGLDVAFYYEALTVEGVRVAHLANTSMSVYCGAGHPLFDGERLPRKTAILEHAFSVPQVGDTGRVLDGWPTELERRVGMRITTLRSNLDVCRSGQLLCVLPDVTAYASWQKGELRRLSAVSLPEIPIYVATPLESLEGGAAAALVAGVAARVEEFEGAFRSTVRQSRSGRVTT